MGKMTDEDAKIILEVTERIHQATKNITFKHDHGSLLENGSRYPNKKEIKAWIIGELREIHFSDKYIMPKGTYYTLKGMTKRGNIDNVLRYIKKFKPDIIDRLNVFKNSKTILPMTIMFKPITPVTLNEVLMCIGNKPDPDKDKELDLSKVITELKDLAANSDMPIITGGM